ncbi:aldehyde dehydrogenase family protein [Natribacillus halophilus]|uniref:Aldehyde dehydrogenase (NAD+) n=1 Tax=Natribacillus halophilus TaxID=549003 RepID=A0A1G8R906_9BACI|nr:aldehyde dehydrogenase family protein [Natribacillus halophilus]SDJ13429.1 aldehyde dehydrogenase (NAD+) [Natribacillus halophilus]
MAVTSQVYEGYSVINGKQHDGEATTIHNPSNTADRVGILHDVSSHVVEEATEVAKRAQQEWASLSGLKKGATLENMAVKLEENKEDIATLASSEMGKPIKEMKGEVARGIQLLRYYAAEGSRSDGDVIPATDPQVHQYSKRVPLGVVGVITPWNFPVAIPIWKMAPALICGNAIVWKPAKQAALTASKLMNVFQEVLPSGLINMLIGSGRQVGNTLLEKANIDALSFTGSTETGMHAAAICASRNIKYQTEMGGKNVAVVLEDADLDKAVSAILSGAFTSAGQKCTASSRIVADKKIMPALKDKLKTAVAGLRVGEALDEQAFLGPVSSKDQYEKINGYVSLAKKEANVVAEAQTIASDYEGYYIHPLIVDGVDANHTLAQEEVFGPFAVLLEAEDFDEAIEIANHTDYGLSASIFTNDLNRSHQFLERSEAGMVRVNLETAGVEFQAPFGGMKMSSSHTREQGQAALEFYSETKTCAIKHG